MTSFFVSTSSRAHTFPFLSVPPCCSCLFCPPDLGDDDEEEAEAAGQDTLAGEDDDEDFLSDSGESAVSLSKMTARQRAAHIGAEPELMELPQGEQEMSAVEL